MSLPPDQRPLDAASLTDDAFLGGQLRILQPRKGFRAGLDAVVLAAAVPARPRQRVCDLGAGAGTAGLCVAARVSGVHVTAVDIDADMLGLAAQNAARNDLSGCFEVMEADLAGRARNLPRQHFHHVLTNPPFHDETRGTRAPDDRKASAKSIGAASLLHWLRLARAITRPGGTVAAILPPAQLPVALEALSPHGRGVTVIPLWPRAGVAAKRMILLAQANSAAPLVMSPGLLLHDPGGKPAFAAEEILRRGKALST
jgi:tRNA1Val (adenine37-N6)-methyltransferase